MTRLLIRLFIKDYQNTSDFQVRERYGKLGSFVSILINVFLSLTKMAAGFLFGNISVTADGFNNLSDAGSAVITFVGFKISNKPADEEHPFGHARVEYITALIISFIVLFLGLQLALSSFSKIITPEESQFNVLVIILLCISILLKLWISLFTRKLSQTIDSTSLRATSSDSMNDVIATGAVLLSGISNRIFGWNLDGYAGLLVSGFVFYSGIQIARDTLGPLLGQEPPVELVKNIQKKLKTYDGVIGIHDLVVHNYGPGRYFATVHVEVSNEEDIIISHDLIDNIERDFMQEMGLNLVIHLDPLAVDDEETNSCRNMVSAIIREFGPDISIHDFRIVKGVSHTNLIFDVMIPYGYPLPSARLIESIQKRVQEKNNRYFCVITVDQSYIPDIH